MRQAEDDDDEEEDDWWPRGGQHFRYSPDKQPHPNGVELLRSGAFGRPPTAATKEPFQKTVRAAKLSLSLPTRSSVFGVSIEPK